MEKRLAIIDEAQRNITGLSQQMVGLQDILSNKQARGAFGKIQLRDLNLVSPAAQRLRGSGHAQQQPACRLPPETAQPARRHCHRFQVSAVIKHVRDIAERYIVAGETAESALLFLPSEAVSAKLQANFRNAVENSFRQRVWIVSPTTLMATLNTVRAILKDTCMREQAHIIQVEVVKLLEYVTRLNKRVGNLQGHFDLAAKDIREIRTSVDKITKNGERIDSLQFEDEGDAEKLAPNSNRPRLTTAVP